MITAVISGSVMIIIIMLLRLFLLKRLPKCCFRLLWILAAIRLVIPFSFVFEVEVETEPPVDLPQTVIIDTSGAVYQGDDTESEASYVNYTVIIKSIFALGTIISGGFLISAYIRMRRIALHADAVNEKYVPRIRGMDVRVGNGASSPFSCGVLHPIIFIPMQMFMLDDKRLDIIIAHESRHIKCGDQLVKWLIAAAVCLNWYNPLVFIMWQFANRDIELACDEAIVNCGVNSSDYALCLIEAEEVRSAAAVCSFGAPVLNERIEFIMKSKKITIGSFVAAGLILSMMTVFFVSVTAVESGDKAEDHGQYEEQSSTDIEAEKEKQTPVDVEIEIDEQFDAPLYVETDIRVDYFENLLTETTVEDLYVNDVPCEVEDAEIRGSEESSTLELSCPLIKYGEITSHFGEHTNPVGKVVFNNGVNVSAQEDTAVYIAAGGTVINAGYDPSAGNFIEIDHGDGWVTVYRHLEEIFVSVGDKVESAEKIGTVGSTGAVTGPNLGFSIIKDGAYLSPEELFAE